MGAWASVSRARRRAAAATAAALVTRLGVATAAGPLPLDWITPGQAEPLIKRVGQLEPFLSSDEAREERRSLGLFFDQHDYEALRGNPVLGYWNSGTFRWNGDRVAWGGIAAAAKSCTPITARAWATAFAYVAQKRHLVVDTAAPIRIRGACVGAVVEATKAEPKRGVELEVRIESPTGVLRIRIGVGKPTIEDAVGASLDRVVGFALMVGRGARR